jgi:prophage regulatory protein
MLSYATNSSLRFLDVPEILTRRRGGRTKLYGDILRDVWPPLIKFGRKSVQPEHEVNLMLAAITAGKTDDELRELVRQIHAKRAKVFEELTGHAA